MPTLDATFNGDSREGGDRRDVRCLYCNQSQPVSPRAMTVNCRFCNKILQLQPLTINAYQARRAIEICALITVDKNGNVFSDMILCQGLVVRGKIRSDIISRGPVLLSPDAEIKGNITATSLAMGGGARLQGRCRIGEWPALA